MLARLGLCLEGRSTEAARPSFPRRGCANGRQHVCLGIALPCQLLGGSCIRLLALQKAVRATYRTEVRGPKPHAGIPVHDPPDADVAYRSALLLRADLACK